jgi:hypothetical protein
MQYYCIIFFYKLANLLFFTFITLCLFINFKRNRTVPLGTY